jgi:hypothetical protein
MVQERLDRKELNFEIPEDVPKEFHEHMAGVHREPVTVKSTGAKKWIWKTVGPNHLRDCLKEQIVFAAMAKCLTIDLQQGESDNAQER